MKINHSEIEFSAIRAQGPGGQHVNKVSSAIHLRFNIYQSSLSDDHKRKIAAYPDYRINKEGIITIKAQRFRSQEKNKNDAIERLYELISKATKQHKPRRATKPSKSSQRKRVDSKVKKGATKKLRRRPIDND